MENKFTPGPWKFPFSQTPETVETLAVPAEADSVCGKGFLFKVIPVENSNGERLAEVKAFKTKGFLQDFDQFEANAKLIVSAPDLIKALQSIVRLCNEGEGSEVIKTVALEAISEATH